MATRQYELVSLEKTPMSLWFSNWSPARVGLFFSFKVQETWNGDVRVAILIRTRRFERKSGFKGEYKSEYKYSSVSPVPNRRHFLRVTGESRRGCSFLEV